ncbi:MAG: caspase family protein [Fimbriimonadaceae bacterium]
MLDGKRAAPAILVAACTLLAHAQRPRLGLQLGDDGILKASLSRDGKLLFTGSAGAAPSARLYDVATGRLIRSFVGHTSTIDAVALSPDALRAATASDDKTLRIWDVHSGKQLVKIAPGEFLSAYHPNWSPDGKYIVAATHPITEPDRRTVRVWNSSTGVEVAKFAGSLYRSPCRFSRDGKFLFYYSETPARPRGLIAKVSVPEFRLVKSFPCNDLPSDVADDAKGKLLFVATGEGVSTIDQATGGVVKVCPANDPTFAPTTGAPLCLSVDKTAARLFDGGSGRQIGTFARPEDFWGWTASASGDVLAMCGSDSVTCFDVVTGKLLCDTKGLVTSVMTLTPVGADEIGLGTDNETLALWSLKSGQYDLAVPGRPQQLEVVAACPARSLLVTGGFAPKLTLRNLQTGAVVGEIPFDGDGCLDARFSPNGKWLAFSTYSPPLEPHAKAPTVQIYDLDVHRVIKRWDVDRSDFVRFSPNSQWLAVTDATHARLFRSVDWTEVTPVGFEKQRVMMIEFTPDGRELWASTQGGNIVRRSLVNGALLPAISISSSKLGAIAFSPRGHRFAAYALYGKFALYDATTHRPLVTLEDPPAAVVPLSFTSRGRFLLGGLLDGSVRVWNTRSGKIVATFVSFKDGTWAAVDPAGRYDASNGGDVRGAFWLLGDKPLALSQFKNYFYDPHLLAKILRFDHEKPRAVPDLNGVGLFPNMTVTLNPKTKLATVVETDQGGGIGPTVIALNGVVIGTHPAPAKGTKKFAFEINTAGPNVVSRLLPSGSPSSPPVNHLEAAAFNATVSIRGQMHGVALRGGLSTAPSNLYALVVGCNYPDTNRTLRYSASDANAFADGLQLAADQLLGNARVHITRLASQTDAATPTKPRLLAAMAKIARSAKPVDVVVVYFAGHGVARAAGRGGYYYLTAEAGNADPESDNLAARYTLSSSELAAWLQKDVKAAKRAIILDTCAAGSAVADLTKPRAIPSDLELAWEQLKDNAGLYVLAGCAPDRVSYEATNVGHGLLTYSLLEAIDQAKPGALASHGFLDVEQWFDYAETRVRELMAEIGLQGMQVPEKRSQANAQDYPVGLVNAQVEGKLGLPLPGPVLILDTFRNADNDDPLNLTDAVDAALTSATTERAAGDVTYWPTVKRQPKALQLRGSYKVSGDDVTVNVRLMRFVSADSAPQVVDSYSVTWASGQTTALAKAIVAATDARIKHDWQNLNAAHGQ